MLKSLIFTGISVASLLAISTIATAKSIAAKSTHNANDRTHLNLITKQRQSKVSQADLKGIEQAIFRFYRDKNNNYINNNSKEYAVLSGNGKSCWFFEVKSVKIISFSDSNAEVALKVDVQSYRIKRARANSGSWTFERINSPLYGEKDGFIQLEKSKNKWKVVGSPMLS